MQLAEKSFTQVLANLDELQQACIHSAHLMPSPALFCLGSTARSSSRTLPSAPSSPSGTQPCTPCSRSAMPLACSRYSGHFARPPPRRPLQRFAGYELNFGAVLYVSDGTPTTQTARKAPQPTAQGPVSHVEAPDGSKQYTKQPSVQVLAHFDPTVVSANERCASTDTLHLPDHKPKHVCAMLLQLCLPHVGGGSLRGGISFATPTTPW